jgi:hypothetical protein
MKWFLLILGLAALAWLFTADGERLRANIVGASDQSLGTSD